MKRIMVTLLSFLLCAVPLKAEAPKTLADYRAIYEREQKNLNAGKEGAEIEQDYLKALTSLERDYKKAGDFPGTKAVLEEKKRFEACRMLPDKTPDGSIQGIADAQKDYRNAIAEADGKRNTRLEKLTTQYIKALKGYTRKLLESDKMSEAEEVNGEIVKAESYLKTIVSAMAPVSNGEAPVQSARLLPVRIDSSLRRGLVLDYSFDKLVGGVVKDSSTCKNHSDVVRDVDVKGVATFSGHNYITAPNNKSLNPGDSITISVWIKANTLENKGIVMKGRLSGSQGVYSLMLNPTSHGGKGIFRLNGNIEDGHGQVSTQESMARYMGEWTHLVGAYGSGEQKIFVNGKLSGAQPYQGPIQNDSNDLIIGGYYAEGFLFQGELDNLMIYDRALSESDVAKLYSAQKK